MNNLFDDIGAAFSGFGWDSALEIALIALVILWLLRLLHGTTAMSVVRGLSIVAIIVVVLSRALDSAVLDWIVNNTLAVLALFVLIVFQPEFRRALERVGRAGGVRGWLGLSHENDRALIHVVAEAAGHLAAKRTGALIVLERDTGLEDVIETGVRVDAVPSTALLEGIFYPNTPLHDGAVVVRANRVVAASCMLPTSDNRLAGIAHLGTRHRAAVGISERSDAITVVISEETGGISVATDGRLIQPLDPAGLESLLTMLLSGSGDGRSRLSATDGA